MLKSLYFHNWRSLQNVSIDELTPITVFIGPNSSGKTNIIDALRFRQYAATQGNRGFLGAVRQWGGSQKIRSLGQQDTSVTIEFKYEPLKKQKLITNRITLDFQDNRDRKFRVMTLILEGKKRSYYEEIDLPVERSNVDTIWRDAPDTQLQQRGIAIQQYTHDYITKRWQILKEGFIPRLSLSSDESIGDLYLLESDGRNLPTVISEMQTTRPEIYAKLQEDLTWLLSHVQSVETIEEEKETRVAIREHFKTNQEAPSISAGTARLVGMLAAYYALDMDLELFKSPYGRMFEFDIVRGAMPGLVIIEEPDMALNPGVLRKFVEQLRNYVDRIDARQFILTTHNPSFLNYFQPEEVRVVSRGEDGYTSVERVPEQITDIWLDEYGLGEVWTTNVFGGIAR